MVRIIDEEAARLDLLIGEAVEMAEIDANVVQVKMVAAASPRAARSGRGGVAQDLGRAQGENLGRGGRRATDEPAWFDPHLLGRVLRHLLENVASYTPPGSRVTLSSKRADDRLEFCVEDNGPGIDALDLPLIFEKFYRGKQGTASAKVRHGPGHHPRHPDRPRRRHRSVQRSRQGARFRFWVPLVERNPSRNR